MEDVPVYRTVYHADRAVSIKEELEKGRIDIVVFTSSSTVEGFVAVTEGMNYSGIRAACIGRQTAGTAAKYNMKFSIAKKADLDDLTELILEMRLQNL